MNKYNFPFENNEIKNFIKSNFNRDEFSVINNDEAFENMYIRFRTQPNNERWIGFCNCVVAQMDGHNRPWVNNFIDKYSSNASVMMILWALFNGIASDELLEIVGY